ncbi:MAG: adenylosuccinate synthetase, partial [Bacteroidales bacterium]|nr:adenylosuccinate synthetase [Bacteroidales bacterium]
IMDAASEHSKGKGKIGSTLRGIGPAYTDKISRDGLKIGDILLPDFKEKYNAHFASHKAQLDRFGFEYDLSEYEKGWFEGVEMLKDFTIANTEYLLNNLMSQGKTILAEGAQGTLLDIDFGSYPFVTSSNTISAGACTGMGISPKRIGEIYGIVKAYCTRVGSGPFPTELFDETGEQLRKKGAEFGATTGRPRRCGWLDLTALKYSIMVNGVTQLLLTKSDVLSGFDTIKVCTKYKVNGKECDEMPYGNADIEPIYETLPGWQEDISKIKDYNKLPQNLKNYIGFIEEFTGVKVTMVSVGPDRTETIYR